MNYYIYCITNKINGKTYIGQRLCPRNKSPMTDLYMGSGELIVKAIKKYGLNNFSKFILEENIINKKELDKREIYWISKFKKEGKCEYNISMGGTGGDLGEEVHELMKKSWRKNYDKRIKVMNSKVVKDKIRKSLSEAHKRGDFDNVFTEEVRKRHSEIIKKTWERDGDRFRKIRQSKEYREKVSKGNKGKIRTEENKRKISEAVKRLHENSEYRKLFEERCRKNGEKCKGQKQYTINGKHRWIKRYEVVPENAVEGWV